MVHFLKRFYINSNHAKKYEIVFYEPIIPVELVALTGCFLFFKTKALKCAGLFDERFFMYFEDIDICRRISATYQTIYFPITQVTHRSNQEHRRSMKLFFYSIISTIKYFNKWGYFDKKRKVINESLCKKIING